MLVVADLIPEDGIAALMAAMDPGDGEAAAELAWAQWWSEMREVEELRPAFAERPTRFASAEFTAETSWHLAAARAVGFGQAGTLWRCGRYAAVAAIA